MNEILPQTDVYILCSSFRHMCVCFCYFVYISKGFSSFRLIARKFVWRLISSGKVIFSFNEFEWICVICWFCVDGLIINMHLLCADSTILLNNKIGVKINRKHRPTTDHTHTLIRFWRTWIVKFYHHDEKRRWFQVMPFMANKTFIYIYLFILFWNIS